MKQWMHHRAEMRRVGSEWERVHPCGVIAERGVTCELRASSFDPATGTWLVPQTVNCPGCVAEMERHVAACNAARFPEVA